MHVSRKLAFCILLQWFYPHFRQIVFIRERTRSSTISVPFRHVKWEKVSLPVDVRRSKKSLLKFHITNKGKIQLLSNFGRTNCPLNLTKSSFLWISPHFSAISYLVNRTQITRIPRLLELNFHSLDQQFTELYLNNLNSGSCNSTRMLSHYLFFIYKGKTIKPILVIAVKTKALDFYWCHEQDKFCH